MFRNYMRSSHRIQRRGVFEYLKPRSLQHLVCTAQARTSTVARTFRFLVGEANTMPKRMAGTTSDHSDEDEEIYTKKKKAVSGDENGTVACKLSRTRKVVVKKFKGKVFVDIREYYNKDGQDLPGKKGISLPLAQWDMLKSHFKDVQKLIQRFT